MTPAPPPTLGKPPLQVQNISISSRLDFPRGKACPYSLSARPSHLLAQRLEWCGQSPQVGPQQPGFTESLFPYAPASPCVPLHYPGLSPDQEPLLCQRKLGQPTPYTRRTGVCVCVCSCARTAEAPVPAKKGWRALSQEGLIQGEGGKKLGTGGG